MFSYLVCYIACIIGDILNIKNNRVFFVFWIDSSIYYYDIRNCKS